MAGKEPSAHADKLSVDSRSARGFIDRQNCCGHLLEQLNGQKSVRSYRSLVVSEHQGRVRSLLADVHERQVDSLFPGEGNR
jgi:hypothetical protein